MTLRINKDTKVSYTLKDIMENEHSELWNKALACVKVLSEVQKHIVDLLPDCRKQLPTHFADLHDIVGTIDNHGLIYESLWVSVVESQDPICSNLKELLDDDKMVRIY
jgi:hypothetical protein